MGLSQEQKILQKQSPATVQLLKIIQMSSVELQKYIETIMQENPVFDLEYLPTHNFDAYKAPKTDTSKDNAEQIFFDNVPIGYEMASSLYDDICMQLDSLKTDMETVKIAKLFALHLDSRAYLPKETYADVEATIGRDKAEAGLKLLQSLTPAGVGARDLSECLCLQLDRLPDKCPLAHEIASKYLEMIPKGFFQQIAKSTGAEIGKVREACSLIRSLNPKPGNIYSDNITTEYIEPDIFMDDDGKLALNISCVPNMALSDYYRRMLSVNTDPEVIKYLRDKFRQAEQIMDNMQKRSASILCCAEAIVRHQHSFFEQSGHCGLTPLTQAQIAKETGLSESTVSRIVNGKYLQCRFGVYPLKFFFAAGIGPENEDLSSRTVKEHIKQLIDNEDKSKPLSDQNIAEELIANGISISRRTVAKYRQQLNISGAFARKE